MKRIIKLILLTLLATNTQASVETYIGDKDPVPSKSNAKEIVYYDDGAVRSKIPLENGVKQGKGYSYYPDGSKRAERDYIDGKINGIFRAWYNDGTLRGESEMKDDIRHGFFREYHQSGNKKEYVEYVHGEVVYMKLYHDDGSILYEKDYR